MSESVVIVDDAAFIREIMRHVLLKNGYAVVGEAADGEEAIDVVVRTKPHFVLMDIILPKKNGLVACQEILEKLPNTTIIACSTETSESMIARALGSGCHDFLKKPFQINELLEILKKNSQRLQGAS